MPYPVHETDLYPPLAGHLEALGYTVHAEVRGTDIAALRDGRLTAVEMKLRFNLDVVLQAAGRQTAADEVYIAVPMRGTRREPPRWRAIRALLVRLGIGVFFVRFHRLLPPVVETALPPGNAAARKRTAAAKAMLREMEGRKKNFNTGGSSRRPLVTAYRTEALHIAHLLGQAEELSLADLREQGAVKSCGPILRKNYYAWFERAARGRYRLTSAGEKALRDYSEVIAAILRR